MNKPLSQPEYGRDLHRRRYKLRMVESQLTHHIDMHLPRYRAIEAGSEPTESERGAIERALIFFETGKIIRAPAPAPVPPPPPVLAPSPAHTSPPVLDDPFGASREQLIALWSVADAAKKFFHFQHTYKLKGTHKHQAEAAFVALGKELEILDHYKERKT